MRFQPLSQDQCWLAPFYLELLGVFLALSEPFHRLGAVMMKILRQWLVSLNEAEHSLRSQGYVVVYGERTSFVVAPVKGQAFS